MEMAQCFPEQETVLAHVPIFRRAREVLTGGGAQCLFTPPPVDECYRGVTTLTRVGAVYEQHNCMERI
jgi:hypothetical protein